MPQTWPVMPLCLLWPYLELVALTCLTLCKFAGLFFPRQPLLVLLTWALQQHLQSWSLYHCSATPRPPALGKQCSPVCTLLTALGYPLPFPGSSKDTRQPLGAWHARLCPRKAEIMLLIKPACTYCPGTQEPALSCPLRPEPHRAGMS